MEIPEEACAPETDIDTDSDSEATAITIQKSKHVQERFKVNLEADKNQFIIKKSRKLVMENHQKFSETTSVRTITPMSFASTAIEVLSDIDSDSFEYPSRNEIQFSVT